MLTSEGAEQRRGLTHFFQELTVICDDSKWDYLIWTSGLLLAGRPADLDLQAAENMMTARVCGV